MEYDIKTYILEVDEGVTDAKYVRSQNEAPVICATYLQLFAKSTHVRYQLDPCRGDRVLTNTQIHKIILASTCFIDNLFQHSL